MLISGLEDEKRKQEGRAKLQIEMKRMLEHQAQQIEEKQAQIARKEIFVSRIVQQAGTSAFYLFLVFKSFGKFRGNPFC